MKMDRTISNRKLHNNIWVLIMKIELQDTQVQSKNKFIVFSLF